MILISVKVFLFRNQDQHKSRKMENETTYQQASNVSNRKIR